METQPEASAGAAQADRQQPMPPSPGATAFKRGRPVDLLHQTGQGKTQLHDTCRRRDGDRDAGDGAQLGVSLAHAPGRSLLPPSFVSSILRFSEDVWFLHACKIGRLLPRSPFDGRPQGGGHLEPLARVSSGGRRAPWIHPSVGPPVPSLELIILRRPAAVPSPTGWMAVRCAVALSCARSRA